MASKPDPDSFQGPGGISLRELHALVKKSHARDQAAGRRINPLTQPQNRWQRLVSFSWGKKRG